jgi:hypothetical protein
MQIRVQIIVHFAANRMAISTCRRPLRMLIEVTITSVTCCLPVDDIPMFYNAL